MQTTWERIALQQAADHVVVRGNLKLSGIAATVFGALALFAGIVPPADPLLAVVGAALALVGLWNLTNPSPMGLALSAGALIMVGLYNVGSGFMDAVAGEKVFVGWQILGVWQVIWGVQGFSRFRRYRNAFAVAVSDDQRAQARAMITELKKTTPKKSADIVEWITRGMTPRMVRARLMQDMALLLIAMGDDVQFIPREELDIEAPDAKPGRPAKVVISMGGKPVKATISAESLQRFRTWKQSSMGLLQRAA